MTVTPSPHNAPVGRQQPSFSPNTPGATVRFSASRLKTWMDCGMQARFHYIDQEPVERINAKTVFGTCVHAALEYYNNSGGDVETAIKIFLDLWLNPEKVGAPVTSLVWPKHNGYSFNSLKSRGIQICRFVHEQQRWDDREVVACEHPFVVPFGKFELSGYVDLIELRKTGKGKSVLRIIDYKTSGRNPNKAELSLDVQFTVYMYASRQKSFWCGWTLPDGTPDPDHPGVPNGEWVYETLRQVPRRAIWLNVYNPKEMDAGDRDQNDFERLYRVCHEVQRAEQNNVFIPKIGDACLFCDYTQQCPLTPVVLSDEDRRNQPNAWI